MSTPTADSGGLMILLGARLDDAAPFIAAWALHATLPALAPVGVVLTRMSAR